MAQYTELTGVSNTQAQTISNVLLENFVSFYDWGFTNKGGYYNINKPASGAYGGDKSALKPIDDPYYAQGRVWQANRGNWVWESAITYSSGTNRPISVSGVWIDNSFNPSGHSIDYKNGRVLFDSPVSVSSNVQVNYSQKWLNVIPAKGVPWLREIQKGSNRVDDESFSYYGSGNWAQLGRTRIQLPTLAIDTNPARGLTPLQLGGGQWSNNDVLFTVIAASDWECKNIADIILKQNDRAINMYDSDEVAVSGYSIYNYNNTLTDFGVASGHYPELIDKFRYGSPCYITDSSGGEVVELSPDLYITSVRCNANVVLIRNNDFT